MLQISKMFSFVVLFCLASSSWADDGQERLKLGHELLDLEFCTEQVLHPLKAISLDQNGIGEDVKNLATQIFEKSEAQIAFFDRIVVDIRDKTKIMTGHGLFKTKGLLLVAMAQRMVNKAKLNQESADTIASVELVRDRLKICYQAPQ